MKSTYSIILIIYNPMSTSGRAEVKATRLARQLKRRGFEHIELQQTDYPGHGEVLAYETSIKYKNPLIISVSGDGGYNEVINGALRAQTESKCRPVCAILAAGNANDHRRAMSKRPLLRAILNSKPETLDLLKLSFGKTERYAHSYIGIGITAHTVNALNAEDLSRWKEAKIVLRSLFSFRKFSIRVDGRQRQIDSLVFANIHKMSKVLRIGDKSNINNGSFSLVLIPHRTRLKFFYLLAKIVILGVKNPPQLKKYDFELTKSQLVQLDGEPMAVPKNTLISVTIQPDKILTLR